MMVKRLKETSTKGNQLFKVSLTQEEVKDALLMYIEGWPSLRGSYTQEEWPIFSDTILDWFPRPAFEPFGKNGVEFVVEAT